MRDLFKRLSPEQKNRDHMSRQFTYVFHGSDNNLPVHTLPGWNVGRQLDESEENVHPSSFHAGSQRAAMDDRFKTYIHVYKIPREHMSEIVRGDTVEDNSYADEAMHGVQSQLFETSPLKADEIADNAYSGKPRVLPYRNLAEDPGSLSFVIPKNMVGKGVEYLGTVRRDDLLSF